MTDFNTEDKPRIQIPIRVNHSLYNKFKPIHKSAIKKYFTMLSS